MQPGERVTWRKRPDGGYGYAFDFPARFVRWAEFDRVVVDVVKADGSLARNKVCDASVRRSSDGAPLVTLRRMFATA